MRGGRLDRKIDIQRKVSTPSESGEPNETWSKLVSNRRAGYRPLKGDERYQNAQVIAGDQVEFRIRYSASVASISPQDRIVYPAESNDSPPVQNETSVVYDILAVSEIGRREGLAIVAQRRPDLAA